MQVHDYLRLIIRIIIIIIIIIITIIIIMITIMIIKITRINFHLTSRLLLPYVDAEGGRLKAKPTAESN